MGIKNKFGYLGTKSDDWNIDKINTVPADLNKLCNIVDNDVGKKTVYDTLLIKLDAIDTKIPSTSRLFTDFDKQGLEWKIADIVQKIPNTNGIVKKTDYSTKIKEIENKLPGVTGLISTATLKKIFENKLKMMSQKEFRIEKAIKRKGDRQYAKWKSCDN